MTNASPASEPGLHRRDGVNGDPHAVSGTRALVAPELASVLDLIPGGVFTEEMLPEIRAAGFDFPRPPLTSEQLSVAVEERFVPGPPGAPDVRVLLYTPTAPAPRPGYLHIHGGGYVVGAADSSDYANRALAAALGCVIVSVDYRLAPETRWPGPVEDCYAALARAALGRAFAGPVLAREVEPA